MNAFNQTPSWRTLLEQAIHPTGERQRIARAVGINPVTLTRWVTGQSLPRLEKLRSLYTVVPSLQGPLLLDYPDLFLDDEPTSSSDHESIPAAFYARIFSGYVQLPFHLRQHTLSTLLIQQVLVQLDPHERGMGVFLAQCVPPATPGDPIRSLRMTMGRATNAWSGAIAQSTCFFGAESQPCDALARGHLLVTTKQEGWEHIFLPGPSDILVQAEMMVSAPILQAERVAGCLCACSTRTHAFSPHQLQVFERYSNLLAAILQPDQFYPLTHIELSLIPSFSQQRPVLKTFQERVQRRLKQATLEGKTLSLKEAEQTTWQELEQLMIDMALVPAQHLFKGAS